MKTKTTMKDKIKLAIGDEATQEEVRLSLQLMPENKKYYDDLTTYIFSNISIAEHEKAGLLFSEILHDLLQAQNDGLAAEEYFGKNPQEIADELLKEFEHASAKAFWKEFAVPGFAGIYGLLLIMWANPSEYFRLLEFAIIGLILIIAGIFASMSIYGGQKTYNQTTLEKMKPVISMLGLVVAMMAVLAIIFFPTDDSIFATTVRIPILIRIVPLAILMVGSVILAWSRKDVEKRSLDIPMEIPLMVFTWLIGLNAIAVHTFFRNQLTADFLGQNLFIYIVFASLAVYLILILFFAKKQGAFEKSKEAGEND